MYSGWISANITDKSMLESFGVRVGNYNPEEKIFENCFVSHDALNKLEPYWGYFIWHLRHYNKN